MLGEYKVQQLSDHHQTQDLVIDREIKAIKILPPSELGSEYDLAGWKM